MPSSISSSERLTAADRPGVAQPVPERPVPALPWTPIFRVVVVALLLATAVWEWRMRALGLAPGDLPDGASAWAEERRRVDAGDVPIAIVGDSRILFDTDLAHFERLTGTRPLQLALPGTNGRPFLEDLAADSEFRGLAIVGITDVSYFRDGTGLMADALDRHAFESPGQRASFVLHRSLARVFAFLDDGYRLSVLLRRIDRGWRAGARGPYGDVWKIASVGERRQTWLWSRIESDDDLRAHARSVWVNGAFQGKPVADDVIARTLDATSRAVAAIRARGGEVVFVRPPSAPVLRAREDASLPRARGWDALLAAAAVAGVHVDEHPEWAALELPEDSHLSRACATVFTDAYVRALAARVPRLRLRPDAPPALTPSDCAARR